MMYCWLRRASRIATWCSAPSGVDVTEMKGDFSRLLQLPCAFTMLRKLNASVGMDGAAAVNPWEVYLLAQDSSYTRYKIGGSSEADVIGGGMVPFENGRIGIGYKIRGCCIPCMIDCHCKYRSMVASDVGSIKPVAS